ncbi:glucose 1-dehydrogenase [Moorella mulderi DSM 14980]|uniref:Glucose 1-dehydrogenase n=2 Tax=Neomoorella TaxID=44260 RepID=A0A151AUZ7_9FIRM|nr:glucose 1-dehydrogenase [Moorella mulderi DSM 14980]
MRLKNKVAVITGAGSGQGQAASLLFAKEGAKVVVADITMDGGNETVENIVANGGEAIFVKIDVSDEEQVKNMIETAIKTFGKIDILYNNAGITMNPERPVDEVTREAWDKVIAVNLTGPFLTCKWALPHFKQQGGGVIINTASTAGQMPRPNTCAYAASKGGLIIFTKQLANEVAQYNIRVNCICPGPVYSTMMKARLLEMGEDQRDKMMKMIESSVPLGHMIMPEDVAECALFLASDESKMITGIVVNVDGGYILR